MTNKQQTLDKLLNSIQLIFPLMFLYSYINVDLLDEKVQFSVMSLCFFLVIYITGIWFCRFIIKVGFKRSTPTKVFGKDGKKVYVYAITFISLYLLFYSLTELAQLSNGPIIEINNTIIAIINFILLIAIVWICYYYMMPMFIIQAALLYINVIVSSFNFISDFVVLVFSSVVYVLTTIIMLRMFQERLKLLLDEESSIKTVTNNY